MHGHAIRLLAEEERIDNWTDFGPGAIYGAIKRLAADGLIVERRTEREGNYPARQIYDITESGSAMLAELRREGLDQIVYRHDPVDLAIARYDPDDMDGLHRALSERLAELKDRSDYAEQHLAHIRQHLTLMESHVMRHQHHRLLGEIAWHEELLAAMPAIIDDENSRKSTES
jgi:DNA-binding PadR family transcriptional regulator